MALLAQPLRALSRSLIDQCEWLLLPQFFHFFTWAGLEVAGVLFVASLAGEGSRATAQALYLGAQMLGNLVGASAVGYRAEYYGYPTMAMIAFPSIRVITGLAITIQDDDFQFLTWYRRDSGRTE